MSHDLLSKSVALKSSENPKSTIEERLAALRAAARAYEALEGIEVDVEISVPNYARWGRWK